MEQDGALFGVRRFDFSAIDLLYDKPMSREDFQVISSPCISVCLLDEAGVCQGCFRSNDEIANWTRYTEQQRREIMDQLGQRADEYGSCRAG